MAFNFCFINLLQRMKNLHLKLKYVNNVIIKLKQSNAKIITSNSLKIFSTQKNMKKLTIKVKI